MSVVGIQVALVLATGLVALWSDSQAAYAAGWHMLGGLPIWIVLALVYNQHETERMQRLAADKLAADPSGSAAIFGNLGDDLDAARREFETEKLLFPESSKFMDGLIERMSR